MIKHKLTLVAALGALVLIAALFTCLFVRVKRLENGPASPVGGLAEPETETPSEPTEPAEEEPATASIATAIGFETQSSPMLAPQTRLAITLPKVTQYADRIVLDVVATAGSASSYSAFVAEDKFILLSPDGADVYAIDVEGNFGYIPPGGSVSGKLTFESAETPPKVILKIETDAGAEYYEFNFQTRTYREARLG